MKQKKNNTKWQVFQKYLGFALILALIFAINSCNSIKSTKQSTPKKSIKKDEIILVKEIEDKDMSTNEEKAHPFLFIQNPPVYPGCEGLNAKEKKACMSKKINELIATNFNTALADSLKLNGETVRIITMFTINKNGKVIRIRARSKYPVLEKEAKRVITLIPPMKPGKLNDKPVNVKYTLPIVFKVGK